MIIRRLKVWRNEGWHRRTLDPIKGIYSAPEWYSAKITQGYITVASLEDDNGPDNS